MAYKQISPIPVSTGGTGLTSATAYAVICGGTTSTGDFQSIAGVGTSGQVLTSNGAGALPTFQNATGTGTVNSGTANQLAYYATTGSAVSGLASANNGVLVTNGSGVPSISTTLPTGLAMQTPASITLTNGTGLPLTTGVTGVLPSANGGTGVNNGSSTITLGGNLTTSGSFASTFTMTNTTTVTFPTTGTLATTAQLPTPAALTKTDDTNVTLTLGGTPATALLQATSLTLGWTGTLDVSRGGIGVGSLTAYAVLCGGTTSTGAVQSIASVGTAGQVLTSNGAGALPTFQNATGTVNSGTANQLAYYASTGTAVSGLSSANSAALVTNSSGVPAWSSTMTNGQVIIGSTSGTPTAATLTAGSGIAITNGAGSITIAAPGGGITFNTVSGTSQSAAVNNGYICTNASQTTVTLPATCAIGDVVGIEGSGAAGWVLRANTGQTIKIGSNSTSSAGALTSSATGNDNCYVTCIVANTTWRVRTCNSPLTYT